jgi:deoxycytidylate deaminase
MSTSRLAAAERPRSDRVPVQFDFSHRESKELVIGVSGAIGCGMEHATKALRNILEEFGYEEIVHLKLSRFIEGLLEKDLVPRWDKKYDEVNRYERLQRAGDQLRSEWTSDFLSRLSIAAISTHRLQFAKKSGSVAEVKDIVPSRVAYVVDQLKHPDEVLLLRKVYGKLFYLVGVLANEKRRAENLRRHLSTPELADVMERDRREEDEHGQQLDKTLKLSDFFIRNNYQNDQTISGPLRRFFALIHGHTAHTPTKDEHAMYAAYSAALRSACLSRQVGAAIADSNGNVIATGCNDVPKAKGGLYSEEDHPHDQRCVHIKGGTCFNDDQKDLLSNQIQELLAGKGISSETATALSKAIRKNTRLRDLIEFSRSVHAEMDAIVCLARKGGPSVVGGKLYTTTFPCHNCARHIVAAGITHVFYIEPYEKSLALELHWDSIVCDVEDGENDGKVKFLHFEGVAPRQFQELFLAKIDRKRDGVAIPTKYKSAPKSSVQYLDSYFDLETKVVEHLTAQGLSEQQIAELSERVAPPA